VLAVTRARGASQRSDLRSQQTGIESWPSAAHMRVCSAAAVRRSVTDVLVLRIVRRGLCGRCAYFLQNVDEPRRREQRIDRAPGGQERLKKSSNMTGLRPNAPASPDVSEGASQQRQRLTEPPTIPLGRSAPKTPAGARASHSRPSVVDASRMMGR
jgi:hypothetical protein